eukprot:8978606-Pyramimonas_sp.AAC.1
MGLRSRSATLQQVLAAVTTDCNAFCDGAAKSESAGLGLNERRAAVEALARRRTLEEGGAMVRRAHNPAQLADGMTKARQQAFNVPHVFLKSQCWKIAHDE